MAGLPGAPNADVLQHSKLFVIGLLTVNADILELVELGVGFLAEKKLILLMERGSGCAQEVHSGHTVIAHCCVQRVIKSLTVHGHALDLVLNKPLPGLYAGTGGVVVIGL